MIRIVVSHLYGPDNLDHIDPDDENKIPPDLVSMGSGLGQWSNELGTNEYITEFCCTGPESYPYKTSLGKVECEAHGLALDATYSTAITLDSMKQLIDEKVNESETAERLRFNMDKITKQTLTVPKKKLHDTVSEMRNNVGGTYDIVPYGIDLTQLINAR